MKSNKSRPKKFWVTGLLLVVVLGLLAYLVNKSSAPEFNGEQAISFVEHQLSLGSRAPGSNGHNEVKMWIETSLNNSGWESELQIARIDNQDIVNVIGKNQREGEWLILGAHYDTRFRADNDPVEVQRIQPVAGANDGASGVAVLLELARVLPMDLDMNIWLVFFDAEDNGNIPGWDWILGSRAFVDALEKDPDSVVIVDMVGDKDLNIHLERNSNQDLAQDIWSTAASLGYEDIFIPSPKYSMLDDHTPFLQAGIRAVDIIDFDYSFWHTTEDTIDKVAAESLKAVGDTLLAWILKTEQNK